MAKLSAVYPQYDTLKGSTVCLFHNNIIKSLTPSDIPLLYISIDIAQSNQ